MVGWGACAISCGVSCCPMSKYAVGLCILFYGLSCDGKVGGERRRGGGGGGGK